MGARVKLHPNAAVRVIRNEIERLTSARVELAIATNDPRIPTGVIADQITQCDREIEELFDALQRLSPRTPIAPQAEDMLHAV